MLIGEVLNFFLHIMEGVFGNGAVLEGSLKFIHAVLSGGANPDTTLLGHVLDDFDEIFAALLGEFRDRQADEAPIGCRIDAELGFAESPFDVGHDGRIVRLDGEKAWLGCGNEASCLIGILDP